MSSFIMGDLPTLQPGATPLYRQIADGLETLIRSMGKDAIGRLLPSETDCVHHFGVSRLTVRQAMSSLYSKGIIARQRGKGTFVTGIPLDHDVGRAFEDEMRSGGHNSTVKLLEWKRVPLTQEMARIFTFEDSTQIYRMQRLRVIDAEIR